MNLEPPFDTFKIEKHAGERKDFDSDPNYPLKGVTYPVDYGDIEGYTAEDGANLDLFVGTDKNGLCGYFVVYRPELPDGEHKFYIRATEPEEKAILNQFEPVITEQARYESEGALVKAIEVFRHD